MPELIAQRIFNFCWGTRICCIVFCGLKFASLFRFSASLPCSYWQGRYCMDFSPNHCLFHPPPGCGVSQRPALAFLMQGGAMVCGCLVCVCTAVCFASSSVPSALLPLLFLAFSPLCFPHFTAPSVLPIAFHGLHDKAQNVRGCSYRVPPNAVGLGASPCVYGK